MYSYIQPLVERIIRPMCVGPTKITVTINPNSNAKIDVVLSSFIPMQPFIDTAKKNLNSILPPYLIYDLNITCGNNWVYTDILDPGKLLSTPTRSKWKAQGLCPKCGDAGYWKALALFCPTHGQFM